MTEFTEYIDKRIKHLLSKQTDKNALKVSELLIIKAKMQQLNLYDVVGSAYMVKVEGNGTMIILAENIADACDKIEAKGYKNYTFVKSTSLDVIC